MKAIQVYNISSELLIVKCPIEHIAGLSYMISSMYTNHCSGYSPQHDEVFMNELRVAITDSIKLKCLLRISWLEEERGVFFNFVRANKLAVNPS